MTIEINSKYDLKDIAIEFGVSINDLKALIDGTLTKESGNNSVIATSIIEAYLHHLHSLKNRLSPLTLKRCDNFLTRFKYFLTNNYELMTISKLNEPILHEFFATCTGRGGESLTTGTQNNYTAIIRAMLKFAWTEDLVEKDYSHKFIQSKASLLPRYLTSEQLKSLLSASLQKTHGYRCHAIISFMAVSSCTVWWRTFLWNHPDLPSYSKEYFESGG